MKCGGCVLSQFVFTIKKGHNESGFVLLKEQPVQISHHGVQNSIDIGGGKGKKGVLESSILAQSFAKEIARCCQKHLTCSLGSWWTLQAS